jgi:SLOG cluster2
VTTTNWVGPVVGLSISEPPDDELVALGLSSMHLRHTFIEVVRHVLAAGWSVAYGGDLRQAGYTEALFDLVRIYEHRKLTGPERVTSYLAWPVWVGRSPQEDVELANVATLVKCPPPPGAPETLPAFVERTPAELFLAARAVSQMRSEMTAGIDRRLVLGGRVYGQIGLVPGVVEEAMQAIDGGVPLYVAGGFGGCGRVLAAALEGFTPPELTVDYQLAHTPRYGELLDAAGWQGTTPNFDRIVARLAATGMSGLRNGLDEEDNRRLAQTDDTEQVVALVMRGLRQLGGA